jgi:hypothetical protein
MEVDLGVLYYYDYKVIHVYHCILRLRLQNEGGLAVWDYSAGKGIYVFPEVMLAIRRAFRFFLFLFYRCTRTVYR